MSTFAINTKRLVVILALFSLIFLSLHLLSRYNVAQIACDKVGADWCSSEDPLPSTTALPGEKSLVELGETIPPLIHQTWKNKDINADSQSWIDVNPGYTYTIYDDADADQFVKENFPDVYQAYHNMPKVILKADLFRYLLLYAKGGTYADVDTHCLKPIDDWTDGKKGIRMIVGIEADVQDRNDWCQLFARRIQLVQWSISSVAGHPAMKEVIDRVLRRTVRYMNHLDELNITDWTILDWTGPGVWTDAILEYIDLKYNVMWEDLHHLEHGLQLGDIYILPITGFSPGRGFMGSKPINDSEAKVEHLFHGVWKTNARMRS